METQEREKTCAERVKDAAEIRLEDIRKLWAVERQDEQTLAELMGDESEELSFAELAEQVEQEIGELNDFGLSIEADLPEEEDRPACIRWILSTGGPHEEFRFYLSPCERGWRAHSIGFKLLDWGDGAEILLDGEDAALLREVFDSWNDCGMPDWWLTEAGWPGGTR